MFLNKSDFLPIGQGPAKVVEPNSNEDKKDQFGITNPNLHRRVDPKEPENDSKETSSREYYLGIHNLNSYRTVKINYHDEESETCEIP